MDYSPCCLGYTWPKGINADVTYHPWHRPARFKKSAFIRSEYTLQSGVCQHCATKYVHRDYTFHESEPRHPSHISHYNSGLLSYQYSFQCPNKNMRYTHHLTLGRVRVADIDSLLTGRSGYRIRVGVRFSRRPDRARGPLLGYSSPNEALTMTSSSIGVEKRLELYFCSTTVPWRLVIT